MEVLKLQEELKEVDIRISKRRVANWIAYQWLAGRVNLKKQF